MELVCLECVKLFSKFLIIKKFINFLGSCMVRYKLSYFFEKKEKKLKRLTKIIIIIVIIIIIPVGLLKELIGNVFV